MAFLSVNHFSRAPLLGTSDLVPFTNEEFAEYISMYTGTPSPAASSFVGAPLRRGNNPNFHTTADAAGLNLAKAALGRDGLRTIFHNRMQDAFVAEADLTRVGVRTHQVRYLRNIATRTRLNRPLLLMPSQPAAPESREPHAHERYVRPLPLVPALEGTLHCIVAVPVRVPLPTGHVQTRALTCDLQPHEHVTIRRLAAPVANNLALDTPRELALAAVNSRLGLDHTRALLCDVRNHGGPLARQLPKRSECEAGGLPEGLDGVDEATGGVSCRRLTIPNSPIRARSSAV